MVNTKIRTRMTFPRCSGAGLDDRTKAGTSSRCNECNPRSGSLQGSSSCITLSYMSTITIRLDKSLETLLARVSRQSGRNRSDVVREALRRQLAIQSFEELRKRAAPFAEAAGYLTDEDVFRDVS